MNLRKFVLPLLLGGLFVSGIQAQSRYPVAVGDVHPDFTLVDVETGSPVSLSDYQGRKVLMIHFASW